MDRRVCTKFDHLGTSMIVHDLNVFGTAVAPPEIQTTRQAYPNRPLTGPIPPQRPMAFDLLSGLQSPHGLLCPLHQITRKFGRNAPSRDLRNSPVPHRHDHPECVSRRDTSRVRFRITP
jgi:hypothetical protein